MSDKPKRSLFEDAGSKAAQAPAGKPGPAAEAQTRLMNRRALSWWQFAIAALVVLTMLIGGLTRLTDSGLSITEWNLVTGVLPPLSAEGWQSEFAKYQTIPEFTEMNADMTLSEFKVIYYWEWGHRMLGRIVGLAFLIPFLFFFFSGRIPPGWTSRIVLPGLLIVAQGIIGWWMVSSGLSGRVDVAPYRLATHLGLAFLVFGLLLWNGWLLARADHEIVVQRRARLSGLMPITTLAVALVAVQILSGALVAGLDAGRGYTDWPLMNGAFIPPEATELTPFWVNLFENPALAQFNHRILGYLAFLGVVLLWWKSRSAGHKRTSSWAHWAMAVALIQVVWGIVTVMNGAPIGLAITHQLVAAILVFVLLRTRFEAAYPSEQKIARG